MTTRLYDLTKGQTDQLFRLLAESGLDGDVAIKLLKDRDSVRGMIGWLAEHLWIENEKELAAVGEVLELRFSSVHASKLGNIIYRAANKLSGHDFEGEVVITISADEDGIPAVSVDDNSNCNMGKVLLGVVTIGALELIRRPFTGNLIFKVAKCVCGRPGVYVGDDKVGHDGYFMEHYWCNF